MDDQPYPEPEFTHTSTYDPESPSHASGMFSHSQQFTVTGKTFTNITSHNYAAPSLPSDFRTIPMGDIDLRHQIRVDEVTGVVNAWLHKRPCVRRMHSAKARIDGRNTRVTVAMYQGDGAEEAWRREITKYMSMRHPNIVQIYGAASSNGVHATLFNDDLIPLQEILNRHRGSHFSTVYIYACYNEDFRNVHNYMESIFQWTLRSWECTKWIRRSTGRLCIELTAPRIDPWWLDWKQPEGYGNSRSGIYISITHIAAIATVIDTLTLEQYHHICGWNLRRDESFSVPLSATVNLGAVFSNSFGHFSEDSGEIAALLNVEQHSGSWQVDVEAFAKTVMKNGWTRIQSGDVFNTDIFFTIWVDMDMNAWLSQANHIFHRLRIRSNFEDYVEDDFEADSDSSSACDFTTNISDDSSNHEEDAHSLNFGSECPGILSCEDHHASESTFGETSQSCEVFTIPKDIPELPLSWSFTFFMITQLLLIFFLALSWMYEHVSFSMIVR
ncbi:hypothetical protein MSAN_00129400 [Mycena sanguinolenta]|uniref:Protein kinase domain-containing protein n=1 Tax=Mycena sanguinolenta TaxID=230812 RepID=A0A8H6ZGV7_9AGAR|nr:hypothetical protein MSAN_00129400 [Mycena sanguinolenta]